MNFGNLTAAATAGLCGLPAAASHGGSRPARCRSSTFLPSINAVHRNEQIKRTSHILRFRTKQPLIPKTALRRCEHEQSVQADFVGCVCLRQSAGPNVAAGSFMWPFVLFMCSCLSSVLCTDGSVPVIDGTLLLWCSRFNGA